MGGDRRAVAATLLAALAASQAALVVLNPVLPEVAADLGISIAAAGQLRTVSGLVAGATALTAGLLAARIGLRELLGGGLAILAVGSALSAAAPGFLVLALAQALVGAGIGISYSVAVAAAAEWVAPGDRSRVLAIALLGPPLAWIVGMPIVGVVGEASWRLAWIAVPLSTALVAGVLLARRPPTPPASVRADLWSVLVHPGVARWSTGELLAFSGWAGSLVFMGALFVESYGLSIAATGFVLGFGALVYVPGNLLFRRWVDTHDRVLLVGLAVSAAATVVVLCLVRPTVWLSIALFAFLSFLAGGRTLAGSSRALHLAPSLRLGVTGVRTAALQLGYFVGAAVGGAALGVGGYSGLGIALGLLFVAATIPHLWPGPVSAPAPPLP
ncbi:MAG TPA: MFS transporter [Gaiellaceae bacterium]|nr:MFS transporter [Gaiellaceae bacterium]